MEVSSMKSLIKRLMFIFFICVSNLQFTAIAISTSTKPSSSPSVTAATIQFETSSLEKPMFNKSFFMIQSDVKTTFATAIVGSSILPTARAAKVADVDLPGVTTDSLNPSMTENLTANVFSEVAATAAAEAQVTIAHEWAIDTKNDRSNKEGTWKAASSSIKSTKSKPSSGVIEQPGGQQSVRREVVLGTSKQYVRQVHQESPGPTTPRTATTSTAFDGNNNRVADKRLLSASNHLEVTITTPSPLPTSRATLNDGLSRGSSENILATPTKAMLASSSPSSSITTPPAAPTAPTTTTTMKPLPVDGYQTVISQAGTHAYLPCNVKQLVRKPISWLRVRDGHILTVDQTTFIADERFQSIYTPNPERWSLQIKFVQAKDAGTYECQMSTEPKTSATVELLIVEPRTELVGESTRHVKVGSRVKLRCVITQALEPPLFINWFHNQKQIYLHNRRDWRTEMERIELTTETPTTASISIIMATAKPNHRPKLGSATAPYPYPLQWSTIGQSSMTRLSTGRERAADVHGTTVTPTTRPSMQPRPVHTTSTVATDVKQITTASLIIPSVEKQDSGNYTCSPSNSAPMTVVLHVLNGEYSASAITSGMKGIRKNDYLWRLSTTISILFWVFLILQSQNFPRKTARAFENVKYTNHGYTTSIKCMEPSISKTTRAVLQRFEEKT